MFAVCTIRPDPHYRRDAFVNGLKRAGYEVKDAGRPASKQDFLVVWNRYGGSELRADQWEADGGTVLVAENGYIGVDELGRQRYALAIHGHNGSGWFPVGADDRFALLGIELQPWRMNGDKVVVRGQRGIGTKQMASPPGWHGAVGDALQKAQALPVVIVEHPGRGAPTRKIEDHLATAAACVVWCSSVGVLALTMGVPVWYAAPYFICADACRRLKDDIELEYPATSDASRLTSMRHMAHGQWTVAELESGEPFARFRDTAESATW